MVKFKYISPWWKSIIERGWATGNRYHPSVSKTHMMSSFLGKDNGWKDLIDNPHAQDHSVERYHELGSNNVPNSIQVWVAGVRNPE